MRFVFSAPSATVFYDFDYEMFVVKFYRDGVALPDTEYFTGDRNEAIEIANAFTAEV